MLKIVEVRLHTTFSVRDQLLLNCRCMCHTSGNSIEIGIFGHLDESNNCLNYLVTSECQGPVTVETVGCFHECFTPVYDGSKLTLQKNGHLWVLEECHHFFAAPFLLPLFFGERDFFILFPVLFVICVIFFSLSINTHSYE